MTEPIGSRLYTVPTGTSLVDALAAHLLSSNSSDPSKLADTLILLPNNRAIKSLTDSFIRIAEKGLLLPRMVAIGDLALDEVLGPNFDPIGGLDQEPILPAIADIDRRALLTTLIQQHRPAITALEAFRLAMHLATSFDQLEVEQIDLNQVTDKDLSPDLQKHWQSAYVDFLAIAQSLQSELLRRKQLNPAARRNALLDRFASDLPKDRPIIVAGVATPAPAIARLLRAVARLPNGTVIWPHVDLTMGEEDWDALGPVQREGMSPLSEEVHPQYHLKLLFDRMGVRREEITLFPGTNVKPQLAVIDNAFCRADATLDWANLKTAEKQLRHVRLLIADDSAEEALSIAILIRKALEQSEKRISLVSPDRELAMRVAAQLVRWGIKVDDSAGQPLIQLPPATLLLGLAEMLADQIGPVSLLSVLKHPLVHQGDGRLQWLQNVRHLDFALRGPRLGIGVSAINDAIAQHEAPIGDWWHRLVGLFESFDNTGKLGLPAMLDMLIAAADALTEGAVWKGQSGRQLAALLEAYRAAGLDRFGQIERNAAPAMLALMLDSEVVRPVYGSHPRVALYGLLEARMQQADLIICGGLNEGTWPQLSQPDPWLAPRLRRELGLPGLDRNIGLSAYDLTGLLGAREVVLSRAKRDRSGPTVASRFLLRIQALVGSELGNENEALVFARLLDVSLPKRIIDAPTISPSAEQRRVKISVTQVDVLKTDPFAFYARKILRLASLPEVDAEPDPAWRGTAVHAILEDWAKQDGLDPAKLIARAESLLANPAISPVVRTLWQPRISAALHWLAAETSRQQREEGRSLLAAESWGYIQLAGVELSGKADRIDRDNEGNLAIIDYKTGSAPPVKKIAAGYALQLGLVGLIAEQGGFSGLKGEAKAFEYWTLNKNRKGDGFGGIQRPITSKSLSDDIKADFIGFARRTAEDAFGHWINGEAPFTAKLQPEYAVSTDYDQLARVYEWYGREPAEREE
jgi:ATP-dependent helicase/nuclease subunit B